MRPLVNLYGETQASGPDGFRAAKLNAVRNKMIELGWSRMYINKSISRIRSVFKFAAENDMLGTDPTISGTIPMNLKSLPALLAGRSEAVELPSIEFVPNAHIEAIRAKVNSRTRDMIDLCLLTGARPGELVSLTTGKIDMTGDVWIATIDNHKIAHKGRIREIPFGPKAKAIVKK